MHESKVRAKFKSGAVGAEIVIDEVQWSVVRSLRDPNKSVAAENIALDKLWDEFDGDNHTTLISSGPDLTLSDNFRGAFGEVGGGLNILGVGGHASAFIAASVKFKAGDVDADARLGFRYQW